MCRRTLTPRRRAVDQPCRTIRGRVKRWGTAETAAGALAVTLTSTSMPRGSDAKPVKVPWSGIAWCGSRTTATVTTVSGGNPDLIAYKTPEARRFLEFFGSGTRGFVRCRQEADAEERME